MFFPGNPGTYGGSGPISPSVNGCWGSMPMGDAPGKDGGLQLDVDLLISTSPACSTHKQLIPGHQELAAYLAGAVPGGGRDVGTVPHLAGQASLQKYLLKKVQLHPEGNRVRVQSPIQVCSRVSRGMNASGCREPSTAQQLQPAPPGSAEGTGRGRGAGQALGL